MLWHLRITRALPEAEALDAFEAWLREAPHTSAQLTGPRREPTIRKMVHDAARTVAAWEARGVRPHVGPGIVPLRLAARTSVPPSGADLVLLARVPDAWLRRKLGRLVAVLRAAEIEHGPLDRVTLGRAQLHRIAGGRVPPASARAAVDPSGETRPMRGGSHKLLVEAARAYGILRWLDWGKHGVRASAFQVLLPPSVAAAAPAEERAAV